MKKIVKICSCCGFETPWLRKRKCPTCGVPALWVKRELTFEEITARDEKHARTEAFMQELLRS
jgi:ribosomal protein L37E